MKNNEIDLASVVRKLMVEKGIKPEYVEVYDNSTEVKLMLGRDLTEQRALMNKFWHLQLTSLDISTIKERFCLISDGEVSDWIRLFEQEVLPFVAHRQLPRFKF